MPTSPIPLLDCPFCGGQAELVRTPNEGAETWFVECGSKECCCKIGFEEYSGYSGGKFPTPEAAVEAWNQRAASPAGISMNFDLCIGGGRIFWEFLEVENRDKVWEDLTASHGWQPDWAEKHGDGSGARCCIVLHLEKIPMIYRWKCGFLR